MAPVTLRPTSALSASVAASIEASVATKSRMLHEDSLSSLDQIASIWLSAMRDGRTLILFGNGGSSTDAQHIAGEMLGRFRLERAALPAICLSDNTATMTAIANDYGYEHVFSRQLAGLGRPGDVAVGLTTSGNSQNVVSALDLANRKGLTTVAFTGEMGGAAADVATAVFRAPSTDTPRIQECHLLAGHSLCEVVESEMAQVT